MIQLPAEESLKSSKLISHTSKKIPLGSMKNLQINQTNMASQKTIGLAPTPVSKNMSIK